MIEGFPCHARSYFEFKARASLLRAFFVFFINLLGIVLICRMPSKEWAFAVKVVTRTPWTTTAFNSGICLKP